jgi:hypothetical protein
MRHQTGVFACALTLCATTLTLTGTTVSAAYAHGVAPDPGVQPACNNVTQLRHSAESPADWGQTAELPGAKHNLGLGRATALSSDGTIALVGATGDGVHPGYANVYSDSGGQWVVVQTLSAADGVAGDAFGAAVGLSGDGSLAVVGAPGFNDGAGSAYVFAENDGQWSQVAELQPPAGSGAVGFGDAVAISADGSTVLVGAPLPSSGLDRRGAASATYAYAQVEGSWQETVVLGNNGYFGASVALSADGSVALIGAPRHTEGGVAFMYTDESGQWQRTGRVARHRKCSFDDRFGTSVALSADGTVAVVGEPDRGGYGGSFSGGIHRYSDKSGVWKEDGVVLGYLVSGQFGASVALSADGSLLLVGAPGPAGAPGATYGYTALGKHAQPAFELNGSDSAAGDGFGTAVALSADGATALVGAPGHSPQSGGGRLGAAYVFASS